MDHYGIDKRYPEGLHQSLYISTALTSASSQLMFGHPPDLMVALLKGQERQMQIVDLIRSIQQGKYVPEGQEVIPGTAGVFTGPGLAVTNQTVTNLITQEVLPPIARHIDRSLAESHASILALLAPDRTFASTRPLQQVVQSHTHPYLLRFLRQFRHANQSHLGFTGTAQAEVTQLLYDGQKNVGYFAGTGWSPLHLKLR